MLSLFQMHPLPVDPTHLSLNNMNYMQLMFLVRHV